MTKGYIKRDKDKFVLSELGNRMLETLIKNDKKNKIKELTKNPLLVALVTFLLTILVVIPLTAHFTYKNTIAGIEYQKTITLSLLGKQELNVKQGQYIQFNGLTIYNPTSTKIALKGVYILIDDNWQRWNNKESNDKKNSEITLNETSFDYPELQQSYKPYMELEPGETRLINGFFPLTCPKNQGRYVLTFFTDTMDGKRYFVDRSLIINVK
jgi:hypothetical protein